MKVVGESMNKRIPNGSWCVSKTSTQGNRQGRVVLGRYHRKIQDPDSGQFTVKIYDSKKIAFEDSGDERITQRPDSRESGFKEIVLHQDDAAELKVIGEFVAVVG